MDTREIGALDDDEGRQDARVDAGYRVGVLWRRTCWRVLSVRESLVSAIHQPVLNSRLVANI